MNVLRRIAMAIGGTVVVALVLTLAVPRAAHAVLNAFVTVANTAANPVPTQSVDNPALQPFQANGRCAVTGLLTCDIKQFLIFPISTTAVVQDVSGECDVESPTQPQRFYELTSTSGSSVIPDGRVELTPELVASIPGVSGFPGSNTYDFGRQSTLYAASTSSAQGSFSFTARVNGSGSCNVNISGYYVKNGL